MAGVRLVRRTNPIRANVRTAADNLGAAIVRIMKARQAAERGADGAALPAPSSLYRQQLAAIGKSPHPGGRILDDLQVLQLEVAGAVARLVFGVTGSNPPRPPRPQPVVFSPKLTPAQRGKALERWRRSTKKPDVSLPRAQVLEYLVVGGGGRKPMKLLGLTPAERQQVVKVIEGSKVFTYG